MKIIVEMIIKIIIEMKIIFNTYHAHALIGNPVTRHSPTTLYRFQ